MRIASRLYRTPFGVLYFRFVVPIELQPAFGRREIRFSLNTKDNAVARMLSRKLSIEIEEAMGGFGRRNDEQPRIRKTLTVDMTNKVFHADTEQERKDGLEALKILQKQVESEDLKQAAKTVAQHVLKSSEPKGQPLKETIKLYLADIAERNLSPATKKDYSLMLARFGEHFSGRKTHTLRKIEIREFVDGLTSKRNDKSISRKTKKNWAQNLAAFFSFAIDEAGH